MRIRCAICDREITAEDHFRIDDGCVYCVTHPFFDRGAVEAAWDNAKQVEHRACVVAARAR